MPKPLLLITLISTLLLSCGVQQQTEEETFHYLGDTLPGNTPLVFGADIISVKNRFDMGFSMSPDGTHMAFGVAHETDSEQTNIYLMHYSEGQWSAPDNSFLPDNANTFFPMFSPSGKELYFAKGSGNGKTDIWVAKLQNNKAIDPKPLDSQINSPEREAGHGISKSGAFYITSNRDDQYQCCGDIYFTQLNESGHAPLQRSEVLSSPADEESLFLSPNDDFIIVQAWKSGFGTKHDLYISYRTKQDEWTAPQRMNDNINGPEIEQRPFVSPDGKYLFFSRTSVSQVDDKDVYDSDIYWVSTQQVFKPYVFNAEIDASVSINEPFELNLPADLFKDMDDNALSYKLTLADNSGIPEWLSFNSEGLTISGTLEGETPLTFNLTATDSHGNTGEFQFVLGE